MKRWHLTFLQTSDAFTCVRFRPLTTLTFYKTSRHIQMTVNGLTFILRGGGVGGGATARWEGCQARDHCTSVHLYICKNETAGCLEWDITVFQAKNQIFSTWTSPDCYSVMIYNSGVTWTLWGDNMSVLPSWSFLSSLIKHGSAEAVCIFYNVGIFLQHELNMLWITEELHDVSDTSTHHMHTYIHARMQSCSSWSCVCGAACSRPLLQHINREQNIRPPRPRLPAGFSATTLQLLVSLSACRPTGL